MAEGRTGLTLMLFSDTGNAEAAVDWQDAAERIVALLANGNGVDVYSYAMAHRILQAIWGEA